MTDDFESAADAYFQHGWCRFGADPQLARWAEAALPEALTAIEAPENQQWLRCAGTWFVGVNALPNDASGALAGVPLAGTAIDFVRAVTGFGTRTWDRAQVSAILPGYPRHGEEESAAAFGYRRQRAAAHVDGLRREGPGRRRFLREPHAFILGIPLNDAPSDASPLVVWKGSHHIVRRRLQDRLAALAASDWAGEDLTEAYHAARREAFEHCQREPLWAKPGEAYLVHRLALHGMATWASSFDQPRIIAYFRPETTDSTAWLQAR